MRNKRNKFYSLDNILSRNARYNIIIGQRSNGKTYACLLHGIKQYVANGSEMAIVRRWKEDFRGKRGQQMFEALTKNDEISKITDDEWTDVYYFSSRWYFCRYNEDDGKRITSPYPFAYGFALSDMEHDKSTSYPNVRTVVFDEFLSRSAYLVDEFVLFMNVLSTIIRQRDDVTIFMCGNTINKYCPYFSEMGLRNVKTMEPGQIDVYEYGESGLRVAVEFSDNPQKKQASAVYFAFDNPKLSMITGTGSIWEIPLYPHCPVKYKPKNVLFTYFIEFDDELFQCEIVLKDGNYFTYIHRKTTPIKNPELDIIYSPQFSSLPNYRRKITKPRDDIDRKIAEFFLKEKVFYQDNECGETIRNYLQWCMKGA